MSESNISTEKNFDLACKLLLSMQQKYFKISLSKYLNMTLSQLTIQYWTELHLSKYIRNVREGAWEIIMFIQNMMFKNKSSVQF